MTGAELERAISNASVHYFKSGRAELRKQHTPQRHGGGYSGKAPLDYRGWVRTGDRMQPVALEAKNCDDTSIPFNDRYLKSANIAAAREQLAAGVVTWFVIAMEHFGEAFRVDAQHVLEFHDAPWRSSLSIAWLRAFGNVITWGIRSDERYAWWLDVRPHPLREESVLAVQNERREANGATVELYPAGHMNHGARAEELRDLLRNKPGRDASDAEHVKWCDRMSELMLERDLREAKRKQATAPRRGRRQAKKGWY